MEKPTFSIPGPPSKNNKAGNSILDAMALGAGNADPSCMRTFKAEGEGTLVYEIHYDTDHKAVLRYIETALVKADTPEKELFVWVQARALWQFKLDIQYQELLDSLTEEEQEKKDIIEKEKEAFYKQITGYEAELNLIYPENPVAVAKGVAGMVALRCLDMCIEINNAPEERLDSYLKEDVERLTVSEIPEELKVTDRKLENGDIRQTQELDESFRKVLENVNLLLEKAQKHPDEVVKEYLEEQKKAAEKAKEEGAEVTETPEAEEKEPTALTIAWKKAAELWQRELDISITKLYLKADKEQKEIISADRVAFHEWVEAREEVLNLLYPEEPEIVAEILAREIMNRVMNFRINLKDAEPKG